LLEAQIAFLGHAAATILERLITKLEIDICTGVNVRNVILNLTNVCSANLACCGSCVN
jgi:hypothetical protein